MKDWIQHWLRNVRKALFSYVVPPSPPNCSYSEGVADKYRRVLWAMTEADGRMPTSMAYVLVVSVVVGALPLADDVIRELVDTSPLGEHHASQAPNRSAKDSTVTRRGAAGCRRCRCTGRILMALCFLLCRFDLGGNPPPSIAPDRPTTFFQRFNQPQRTPRRSNDEEPSRSPHRPYPCRRRNCRRHPLQ